MAEAFLEVTLIGDRLLFWTCVFAEKLSPFVWQMSFTFVIDERLACYLITELLAVTLLFVVVLFYHNLVRFLCPFI